MLEIVTDLIPSGRRNRPGYPLTGPRYITVHDTANPNRGADALAHARYLKGPEAAAKPVSWHFTVDDTRAVQHLPTNEVGWHAGDGPDGPGNRSSLGIEICENADGNRAQAEKNAAELIVQLLQRFGLGVEAVVQHHRWTGKDCPHLLRAEGWDKFVAKVADGLAAVSPAPAPGNGTAPPNGTQLMAENARMRAILGQIYQLVKDYAPNGKG